MNTEHTNQSTSPEPFGYFKAEPFGWTDCEESDEGAIALYDRPQAEPVNQQLLALVKSFGHKAGCAKNAFGEQCTCGVDEAMAAAEQSPRWPQVDMGFGKFAVGSCTCAVTGVPGLLYLHLDERRPHNADCSDVFPVGSTAPEDRIASIIHFHSAQALQQTIDELLAIQREHYQVAEQAQADHIVEAAEMAQQAEPVALDDSAAYEAWFRKETGMPDFVSFDSASEWAKFGLKAWNACAALAAQPPVVAVAVAAPQGWASVAQRVKDSITWLLEDTAQVAQHSDYEAGIKADHELAEACQLLVAMLAAAPQAATLSAALADIAAERRRQIEAEGWTPEHDDAHSDGQMATAAACYAISAHSPLRYKRIIMPSWWPWDSTWWKPSTTPP